MRKFIDGGQLFDLGQLIDGGRRNPITGGGGCIPTTTGGAIEPEDGDFAGVGGGEP